MKDTLTALLEYKNLGTIIFNDVFDILAIDTIAERILNSVGDTSSRLNLMDIFPEFIGNEDYIQKIVAKKKNNFRLEFINRKDKDNNPYYLNIIVLAHGKAEKGFLVIENVTEQALALQSMNQQKYELMLYKGDPEFRKQFLAESILGNSEAIQQIRKTIQTLSSVPTATVLLMGETGSGKNLAARVIHYSSMAPDKPFVEINCAALPDHLIESELFGYEKGAFTHAVTTKPGLLEEAQEGTIFLDELGEMPLNMQAKLLNVLETGKFRRLGSNKSIKVNFRVIAATNIDLQNEVNEKRFRKDLFYRLNVVSFTMPPLREMGEDILVISEYLLKLFNIEFKKTVKGFTEKARKMLLSYPWPGNVRELSNCLERAMIFADKGTLDASDLVIQTSHTNHSQQTADQWTLPPGGIVLEEVERQLIVSALAQSSNNKSKAARLLGLTRDTLRYRLEKYQLT